jgi:hypothetical protein
MVNGEHTLKFYENQNQPAPMAADKSSDTFEYAHK